jgi:hypothetical protein
MGDKKNKKKRSGGQGTGQRKSKKTETSDVDDTPEPTTPAADPPRPKPRFRLKPNVTHPQDSRRQETPANEEQDAAAALMSMGRVQKLCQVHIGTMAHKTTEKLKDHELSPCIWLRSLPSYLCSSSFAFFLAFLAADVPA